MVLRAMNAMEWFARFFFCSPTPEGYSFDKLSKPQKAIHRVAIFFDIVDLIDTILDIVAGVRLWMSGEGIYGFFLLCGIFLGRLVASKGKRVMMKDGLQWAPFFQDRREFYLNVGQDSALPTLFAILFTELSVFLFEDATLLGVWIFSRSFDKTDTFDRLNAWATLLSVVMCILMLLVSSILWLRLWIWKPDFFSKVCQVLSAISFLAIFGVIVLFMLTLVFYGFQTIAKDGPADQGAGFIILVCLSWAFGSFFACTLRQKSRVSSLPAPAEVTHICDQQDNTLSVVESTNNDLSQDALDLQHDGSDEFVAYPVAILVDEV